MNRDKRGGDDSEGGVPGWMVTYGDMMTLLLVFFVLLLSFSTIHEEEFQKAISSLREELGAFRLFLREPANPVVSTEAPNVARLSRLRNVGRNISRRFSVMGTTRFATVRYTATGLKITLNEQALFDSGQAELKDEARGVLAVIATSLAQVPGLRIQVGGHSDNLPVRTGGPYSSNFELSGDRALNVLNSLMGFGLRAEDLSFAGYGEYRPLVNNDTPENRAKNRRVEISAQVVAGELESREASTLTEVFGGQ